MAKRLDKMYAEFTRSNVALEGKAEIEEARSEDRFVMWLVGISAAVVVLTVSNLEQLRTVSVEVVLLTTIAFTVSIICGVVFRMMFLGVEKEIGVNTRHYNRYAHLEAMYDNPPSELAPFYNAKQIATEIKNRMGKDYMALLEDNADVAFWQKLYDDTMAEWLRDGLAGLEKMQKKEYVFAGKPEDIPTFPRPDENPLMKKLTGIGVVVPEALLLERARKLNQQQVASRVLLWGEVLSFLCGVCVAAGYAIYYLWVNRC